MPTDSGTSQSPDLPSSLSKTVYGIVTQDRDRQRDEVLFNDAQSILRVVAPLIKDNLGRFPLELTPTLFCSMRMPIYDKGLAVTHVIAGSAVWGHFVSDSDFSTIITPASRLSEILAGKVGTILGSSIITDAFFSPDPDSGERHIPYDVIAVVSILDGEVKDITCARV